MKITLVCSSIEPGRDGVGDYSRLLAGALIDLGHNCTLLALNDKFVSQVQRDEQLVNETTILTLRIPCGTFVDYITEIQSWIKDIDPDLLSLQYVIFGYDNKGLPFGLSKKLLAISQGRKWHIMFHELWLGMAVQESVKLKIWGLVQRLLITTLIHSLKPSVINTQTQLYITQLKKLGYKASYLPLFSNIPLVKGAQKLDGGNVIKFVVFGSIHTGALIKELAADAAEYASAHNTPVLLTFIGRCGDEQKHWISEWKSKGLDVKVMGDQSADIVSAVLQNSTIGIASTGVAVIEKSGAFAAMRVHGLPVLNISKPWQPAGTSIDVPLGVTVYTPGTFADYITSAPVMVSDDIDPEAVAKKMLAQF